jgi:FKBP-type peptidyl-prolyl cis-trans isomerase FkpA
MRITLFFLLLGAIALVSCQPEKQKTSQGYEYIVHKSTGTEKPKPGDYVYFHAYVRNGDSVVMNTRTQPQLPHFQLSDPSAPKDPAQQPSPVEDVLRNLGIGDSATIFIPLDTVTNKPVGFEDAKMLYYDIVLMDIKTNEEYMGAAEEERKKKMAEAEVTMARMPEIEASVADVLKKYKSGALASQIKTTASGLKYLIQEEGSGPMPALGKPVTVHYHGLLTDGKMFDSSFGRGEPIQFPLGVGQVIPGWDEGLALLKEGTKATLFIPYQLAYGEAGSPPVIPAKAELVFYVELVKAQ